MQIWYIPLRIESLEALTEAFSLTGEQGAGSGDSIEFLRNCIKEVELFSASESAALVFPLLLERAKETFLKSSSRDSGDLALLCLLNM